jgi:hypothetical protein
MLVAVLIAGAASAQASSPIEGVWSFNGGKVAIQPQPDGSFTGTVVSPTKFAQCTHSDGEQMWTQMRQQPDGSFWGFHQWFFATEACVPNPQLGLSAWRVMQTSSGSTFLRACFSEPGTNSQPTISASGATADATFGCDDSALVSPVPVVSTAQFSQYAKLPTNKACYGRGTFRVHLSDPTNDPIKKAVVKLQSGSLHRSATVTRKGETMTATVSLNGLPKSTFTVSVRLTTVLGDQLSGKRTYRSCSKSRPK